jgi:hypothetical protein
MKITWSFENEWTRLKSQVQKAEKNEEAKKGRIALFLNDFNQGLREGTYQSLCRKYRATVSQANGDGWGAQGIRRHGQDTLLWHSWCLASFISYLFVRQLYG